MENHPDIRVMCVDDNEEVLEALCKLISRTPGLSCVAALNAADHLAERATDLHADVVVLDYFMPGSDVLSELHRLAHSGPARAIIFSGHVGGDMVGRVMQAGASACICKTVDPDELIAMIRSLANAHS